ncbi:uncharacterized protein LOC116296991 [Actinia tenebrosa]|uniref:Uncharacterized protein LOC116296991 n=1 Tax=Actinia tenebrosa TaxID=6105 RepID=A0A6P8HX76_ACTTE|nr:uncharacterized protein LOC116296991 [Actinia tenebrosa]
MASCKKPESGKSVCDGKDEEFSEGYYKICCLSNEGDVQGHFLKIDDNQVTANASRHDEKAVLKIRAVQNEKDELVMIIENGNNEALSVEHDELNDKYQICVRMNEELEQVHKLRDAEHYKNNYLFKKVPREPGSEIFQITSNATIDGKPLTVAFDEYGKPMDPMQNHHEDGSFFRLLSA